MSDSAAQTYPEGGLPHGEHPYDYGYEEPVRCARCEGYDLPQLPHALGCPNDKLTLPLAGRFVLFVRTEEGDFCVKSWNTWEEASVAFPIVPVHVLRDRETGREWLAGVPYEWEAART